MLPTTTDVHVDVPLSHIASNWIVSDQEFVAGQVFPIVRVQKQSNDIWQYDRKDLFRVHEVRPRADATESVGGGYHVEHSKAYSCTEYAYHKDVGDKTRRNTDRPLDADRDATHFVTQLLKLKREYLFAQRAFQPGIWGQDFTGVAGASDYDAGQIQVWDDHETPSTPIEDVDFLRWWMRLATGGWEPNTLVLNQAGWNALKHHPTIVNRYVQTQAVPVLTPQMVANVLELERVVVA